MHKAGWLVSFVATMTVFSDCFASETITIVADKWCPYNCAADTTKQGYIVDMVRTALKKSNIDVVYKVVPWSEALDKTRKGEYDAVIGASRGDAPDFIFPEVVQGISINQFWVTKDSAWKYKDISSLSGIRLGVISGYSYSKSVDAYIKAKKDVEYEKLQTVSDISASEINIEKLLDGRVDTILEDQNVIEYYFASRHLPVALKPVGNPVDQDQVGDTFIYLAFSPNNPKSQEYAKLLTQEIKAMRKSGEMHSILSDYQVNDAYQFEPKKP